MSPARAREGCGAASVCGNLFRSGQDLFPSGQVGALSLERQQRESDRSPRGRKPLGRRRGSPHRRDGRAYRSAEQPPVAHHESSARDAGRDPRADPGADDAEGWRRAAEEGRQGHDDRYRRPRAGRGRAARHGGWGPRAHGRESSRCAFAAGDARGSAIDATLASARRCAVVAACSHEWSHASSGSVGARL